MSPSPLTLPSLENDLARVQLVLGRGRVTGPTGEQPDLIPLDTPEDAEVEVWVDGRLIAWGVAVDVDGKLSVRITRRHDASGESA